MRIAFDYLVGPQLGHRTRCEVLERVMKARGHEIVSKDTNDKDWLVYDYPSAPTHKALGYKRLLMGQYPTLKNDYAWHPLGEWRARTLVGKEYIIVEPRIDELKRIPKTRALLITCGGSDKLGLTEELVNALAGQHPDIVIGPNFKQRANWKHAHHTWHNPNQYTMLEILATYQVVVATWGQTVFEALALGARVLPIITRTEHEAEAHQLGIPFKSHLQCFDDLDFILPLLETHPQLIDTQGAERLIYSLERM